MNFLKDDFRGWASYFAYASTAQIIPIVVVDMARDLGFPLDADGMAATGALQSIRAAAVFAGMLLCAWLAPRSGIRRLLAWAFPIMSLGAIVCMTAQSYYTLLPGVALMGFGAGAPEALGKAFISEAHRDNEPARYVNLIDSSWGLWVVVSALGFGWLLKSGLHWRFVIASAALTSIPGLFLFFGKSSAAEKKSAATPTRKSGAARAIAAVISERRFWLYFVAVFLACGITSCLTFWAASFARLRFGANALTGGVAAALFCIGMFSGRALMAFLVPQRLLKPALLVSAIIAVAAFTALPLAHSVTLFLVLLLAAGIFSAPHTPSVQCLAVEHLSWLDATQTFVVLAGAAVIGSGVWTWFVGKLGDTFGIGSAIFAMSAGFALLALLVVFMNQPKEKKAC